MEAYVDDLVIRTKEICSTDIVKTKLDKVVVLKDLGRASEFFWVIIICNDAEHTTTLNQAYGIPRWFRNFIMDKCETASKVKEKVHQTYCMQHQSLQKVYHTARRSDHCVTFPCV